MTNKAKSTKKLEETKAIEERNEDAPDTRELIGERLRMLRKKNKLMQPALAEKLGWGQSKVSKIECGVLKLNVVEFLQMMDAMQCSKNDARDVLYGKRPKKKKGGDSSEDLQDDGSSKPETQ